MKEIKYKIILDSNFLTGQIGVIGKDIDITYKRDLNGEPIIYGKHIKGILKERFIQFKNALELQLDELNIFGKEGNNISKIFFSNLKINNKETLINKRTSIKVDRKTRTTLKNSLFNYEFIESNQEFEGSILFKNILSKEELKLLLASLFHLDKIGGLKSRGLGSVTVKIEYKNEFKGIEYLDKIVEDILNSFSFDYKNEQVDLKYEKYSFSLDFLSPLVLKKIEIGNIVETRTDLQGSTLRGALINLGLEKGYDISTLLDISVKLFSEDIKLNSVFKTKYKVNGNYIYIDKIISDKTEEKINGIYNKYLNSNFTDFKFIEEDISIAIDSKTKISKSGQLFNTEIISKTENMPSYKGTIFIPEGLISDEEIIYIGKYKSKGFGKVKIKINKLIEEENIKSLEENIKNLNKNINENYTIITFDLMSDLILPNINIVDPLKEFINLFDKENKFMLEPIYDKSFIKLEKLEGFNIINNIRKADEIVIKAASVLTYKIDNLSTELMKKLQKISILGLGLRKKEGFGMINICSNTEERCGNYGNF